jgi:hypothetical protein
LDITSGRYRGYTGVIDSAVCQSSVDYPDEYAAGYHVVLEDERVVTVRWDQVSGVQGYVAYRSLWLDRLARQFRA